NLIKTQYRRYLNTNSDSEILLHLMSIYLEEAININNSTTFLERLCYAINKIHNTVHGSYSVVCAIAELGIIGFRDPHGIKPLILGQNNSDGYNKYILASENTPFFSLDYDVIDNINPGEVVYINAEGELH